MRALIDKLFRRLAIAILDRADERHLHPKRILLEEAQRQSADYARDHMMGAMILDRRDEILDLALARAPQDGLLLEFGVANGDSIRHLAARTSRTIHGFDSFEGLPARRQGALFHRRQPAAGAGDGASAQRHLRPDLAGISSR
jgi:hypothetical protein